MGLARRDSASWIVWKVGLIYGATEPACHHKRGAGAGRLGLLPDWLQPFCLVLTAFLSHLENLQHFPRAGRNKEYPRRLPTRFPATGGLGFEGCPPQARWVPRGSPSDFFLSLGLLITYRMRSFFSNVFVQPQMLSTPSWQRNLRVLCQNNRWHLRQFLETPHPALHYL